MFVVCLAILSINMYLALKGRRAKLRRIAGLDAIDEGVGRAVELRRPVAVDLHTGTLSTVDGVLALTYLDYAARKAAEVGANFVVGLGAAEVTPVATDIVRSAYILADKEEMFNATSMIRFISPAQWGYTGGWLGLVAREKPGLIFIPGSMGAEVMLIAEAGQWVGAMQIACSTSLLNIPFLVAGCDYVIMGEEFYAGAAMISQNPVQLGCIVGQDHFRLITISLVIFGSILVTLGSKWLSNLMNL